MDSHCEYFGIAKMATANEVCLMSANFNYIQWCTVEIVAGRCWY